MRWLITLAMTIGISGGLTGCGGSDTGPTTGPKGEPPKEQVENDDMMQKGIKNYQQKARKR
jgi:hypothetical protein